MHLKLIENVEVSFHLFARNEVVEKVHVEVVAPRFRIFRHRILLF